MKVESNRRMLGEWHVRIWQGDDQNNGTSTTWPIPCGEFWSVLREKLSNGVYVGDKVSLSTAEFMALRDLVHAYGQLVDKPRWLLDELSEAMDDAEKSEDPF
jgi:hypothetical protein